jgi:hypothetical protein
VTVIQLVLLVADQAQPDPVETVVEPAPPLNWNHWLVGLMAYWQPLTVKETVASLCWLPESAVKVIEYWPGVAPRLGVNVHQNTTW